MALNISELEKEHQLQVSRFVATSSKLSQLDGTVLPITTFTEFKSDNFKLPVKVGGRLISAGTFEDPKYGKIVLPFDELKKVYPQWEGKDLFKYHDAFWQRLIDPLAAPADAVVGRIVKTVLNEKEKAIDYFAEIYDRDFAYKIYTRLIKQISVGFMNDVKWVNDVPYKTDLIPQEASFVYRGKDPNASVQVTEISY